MSSIVTIQLCKFTNYPQVEDSISYGYRCYDDYGATYNNIWEKEDIELSPIEILKKVYDEKGYNNTLELMFDFIVENELGIFIGTDWLTWDQIKMVIQNQKKLTF